MRLLDRLVLGEHDLRNALPMAPELVLQLALEIIQAACLRSLQQGDNTLLVRVMELIKCHIDLNEETFLTALTAKLQQAESADAHQLWVVSRLAAKHRRTTQRPRAQTERA